MATGAISLLLVLGVIVLSVFHSLLTDKQKPKTCKHGRIGHCFQCEEEATRLAERKELERRWELLRRSEIRRLSRLRLESSSAYFEMAPREFEFAIARLFRKLGYKVAQTAFVADGGKDAIAWKEGKKYVIECKRYGSRSATGRRDLQILLAAKHDEKADGAIFVSTGRFTAPAIAYAIENRIECYDRQSLPDLVNFAYGTAKATIAAHTICLECGAERSIRLKKKGPSTGNCSAAIKGVKQRHQINTSIDLSQLRYPDLDLDAPWCHDHHVPMRRVDGYRGEFWGCPVYPNCRNTGGPTRGTSEDKRDQTLPQ